MLIDWFSYERNHHVLAWFLVEAMSSVGIDKFKDFDSSKLDVVLTVNGIEVPFEPAMLLLQESLQSIEDRGRKEGKQQAQQELLEKVADLLGYEEEDSK